MNLKEGTWQTGQVSSRKVEGTFPQKDLLLEFSTTHKLNNDLTCASRLLNRLSN
jgi:hypothetical protein